MTEFEKLFGDEFFIIDSNDLNSAKTKLYGFLIDNERFITDDDLDNYDDLALTSSGAYVFVKNSDDEITIHQDFVGSYGIYVYEDGENFCLSNSFLKLVDYVKQKYELSLNYDYARPYFTGNYSHFGYKYTLVNEIVKLPRNYKVNIDIKTQKMFFSKKYYEESTVAINSEEALSILDDWFVRWTSFFRNLKNKTNNITIDLSAGYDSRLTFALILASNIDLTQVKIRSVNDGHHTHDTDYKFATDLAKKHGFKLNDNSNFELDREYFKELETSMNISFYTKLGFHNQLYYKTYRNKIPCYSITGYGGENLRNYSHLVTYDGYLKIAERYSPDFVESTKKMMDSTIENINNDFDNIYANDIEYGIYKETILVNHFGRGTVEKFFTNEFSINPLYDSKLYKIKRFDDNCKDGNLLLTLIFLRYCPELLDYPFNGTERIDEETIDYARKINEKHPFVNKNVYQVSLGKYKISKDFVPQNSVKVNEITDILTESFLSNSFKKSFEVYFANGVYDLVAKRVKSSNYIQLQYAYPLISFMKIVDDVKYSNSHSLLQWAKTFLDNPSDEENRLNSTVIRKLLAYTTARLDIINYGDDTDVELISIDDENSTVNQPSWLKTGASGLTIESFNLSLDLRVKCINEGNLKIILRTKDIRDKNRIRFPIYVDFTNFQINGVTLIDENRLLTHDDSYIFEKNVVNGEIIHIHLDWKPFDHNSDFSQFK